MKHTSLFLFFSLLLSLGHAQVITLLHNGTSTFFYETNDIAAVLNAAAIGDTIVLPGGPITPSGNLTITKRLVWVGAGYRPDTNMVTTPTVFTSHPTSQIFVRQGASGSRFHGIRFERAFQVGGGSPEKVTDIGITRCEFTSALFLAAALGNSASNVQFRQSVMRQGVWVPQGMGIGALNAPQGLLIENCIIVGSIDLGGALATGNVKNSILLSPDLSSPIKNNGLAYVNCIFANSSSGLAINNPSYFQDCLFAQPGEGTLNWGPNAINSGGCEASILTHTNVFINVPHWSTFAYNHDYHLTPTTSPALNMGGVDSGVYGGPVGAAWKEGGIPFNPHWISLSSSLGATTGGVINVNFSGAAQQD